MKEWQILFTVEIPLSLPLLLGGLRGAVLQVVATATLVAYVGMGGLGYESIQGIPLRRFDQTIGTALVIVALALVLDALLGLTTKLATPRGVRVGRLDDVRARERTKRTAPVTVVVASPEKNETREKENT
jgi:osmoprotectant transport system permease protein